MMITSIQKLKNMYLEVQNQKKLKIMPLSIGYQTKLTMINKKDVVKKFLIIITWDMRESMIGLNKF